MSDNDKPGLGDWRAAAEKDLKGRSADDLNWETPEGITVKALYELERVQGRRALITMCIGGGQGIALAIERI